jgi:hypothetical protein
MIHYLNIQNPLNVDIEGSIAAGAIIVLKCYNLTIKNKKPDLIIGQDVLFFNNL